MSINAVIENQPYLRNG